LKDWQDIADTLAEIAGIPAALIMRLTEPHIEVTVSSQSQDNPYHPGDKEIFKDSGLYCETVIKRNEKLCIPDALSDENWKDNPDVKLNMISYLGYPILLPDKKPFGTICVLDNKPNHYSPVIEKLMVKFRSLIESHLELIYMNQVLGDKNRKLTDYLTELKVLRDFVPICSYCKSIRNEENQWKPVEEYIARQPDSEFTHSICPDCLEKHFPDMP